MGLVCVVVLSAAWMGCGAPERGAEGSPNVIIISLDTVRWDRTSLADPSLNTTPNLAYLASLQGSTVFSQAHTPGAWSLPAYASLFTGQGVMEHGVGFTDARIDDQTATLPEVFSAYGYRTAGFVTGPHVTEYSGFARGFEHFSPAMHSVHLTPQVNDALAWLDDESPSPFFLFLHGYDAHLPYASPAVFSALFDATPELHEPARSCAALVDDTAWTCRGDAVDGQMMVEQAEMTPHMMAHYDSAVRHADHQLGRLLHALSVRGHLDNTIIVAMSDHGESLAVPDPFQHDWACGEEVFHVPLVIRVPEGASPVRSDAVVSLADVLPTLTAVLGLQAPAGATGRVLLGEEARTGAADRIVTAASKRCHWAKHEGWTLEGVLPMAAPDEISWKLRKEGSVDDVSLDHPAVFERLQAAVSDWPTQYDVVKMNQRPGRSNKAIEKALRDGGYWSRREEP